MNALTITLGTAGALLSLVCWAYFFRGAALMVRSIGLGQPDRTRMGPFVPRFKQMCIEFAAHTRMNKFRTVGWAHWLVMVGFMFGAIVWFEAYGQTFNPEFHWPIIGDTAIYHFLEEILALGTVIGIIVLIVIRQLNHPRDPERLSRFSGSNFRAAYFVETVVLIEGLGMLMVKSGKIATYREGSLIYDFASVHIATLLPASPELVSVFAFVKLMSGMVWLLIVGRNITWGVAWHRFSAFFNIYFKREADGSQALGAAKPMMSGGKVLVMEDADPDVDAFGAGKIEDFSWKGWLDFTTCTECGRCQSQCPAWNTGKPLSPKLLITSLRDHGNAKAPYLLAGGRKDMAGDEIGLVDADGKPDEAKLAKIPQSAIDEASRPLVGETSLDDGGLGGIIDPEVLWSCTSCGACVEQCPVDIEHVDHILDMRRYQVLIESEFPSELSGLFKNLENKGNPWGQNAKDRLNWINELEFDIPVYGQDADSFDDFEYLFWVGCAGAYEDRAKKTTKAVAELLATAGVKFMVLGADETCTGDSARRAGNEFLFQQLALQNVETLNAVFEGVDETKRKIVVTCAHCFNALGNEYPQVGGKYEVVHHTQLLNRLVRAKKLIPVASVQEDITYHDPCFLGRHNKVYDAPRELMAASGSNLKEMPRHGERSMCCGAGGARMWMEEKIGKRINIDRVDEALSTSPKKIATGCPFCRVMLNDGVTARQEAGQGEGVEVVDVAQLLLGSITRLDSAQLGENVKVVPREKVSVAAAVEPVDTPKAESVTTEKAASTVEAGRLDEVTTAAAGGDPEVSSEPAAGKGLKMKGLAKAPGAKAPGAKAPGAKAPGTATSAGSPNAEGADADDASQGLGSAKAPGKGLGMAGGAKAPGKGLGMAGGAKAPGKGLGMAGGAKAPGKASAAAPAPAAPASSAPASATPAAPASSEGTPDTAGRSEGAPDSTDASTDSAATEVKPTVKAKGLAVKSGFKKPGAKAPGKPAAATEANGSASAASAPASASAPAPASAAPASSEGTPDTAGRTEGAPDSAPAAESAPAGASTEATETMPTVKAKGLAVKSGFKKPGAKAPGKPAAAAPAAPAAPAPAAPASPAPASSEGTPDTAGRTEGAPDSTPETESAPEPEASSNGTNGHGSNGSGANGSNGSSTESPAPPKAKAGGLGFKSGAKAPGRKS